jgi:outer membrane protein assembly factor BamB
MRVSWALLLAALVCAPASVRAGDWVHWRGPEQNGVSRERDLPEKWNELWSAPYGARSTPIILNDRVYLIGDVGEGLKEQERVLCCDANTGKLLWEHRMNVFLADVVSSRVGWSNLAGDAETGNIYAHGTQGLFICFDKDGKILWSRSMTEEFGRISGYGGRIASPIVDGDLVIVGIVNSGYGDQSRGSNRFVAFDKRTGQIVWWSDTVNQIRATYYSSPVVAVIGGQRLLISGGGDGAVHAFKVRTGEKVWSYIFSNKNINSSPVVDGDLVYIAHGEESPDTNIQGRIICVNGAKVTQSQPELVWKVDGLLVTYSSPVIHDGRLYVIEESGTMHCLDGKTGQKLWGRRGYRIGGGNKGSPVWADGKLYVPQVEARFHILKPGDKGCESLDEHRFSTASGQELVEVNGSPSVANGKVYIATANNLYCIGKKDQKAKVDPIPPQPKESPVDPKAEAAFLQIFPADVSLLPGASVSYKVKAYNDKGQYLRDVPNPEWSMPVPPTPPGTTVPSPHLAGKVENDTLTVDKEITNQQAPLVASLGKVQGRARVRVLPALPISEDFSKVSPTRTPAGWVGVQGKFTVEVKDGKNVLRKLTENPNPLLARCYTFMGRPEDSHYTIECDIMGGRNGENLPDMGVSACRYTMVLGGNKQELCLRSWEALPRVDKTIGFAWKPDVWYRMKLTTKEVGDSVEIQGKVWPRDQPEPKDWTITFSDPMPNRNGSPGLYAYATGTEVNKLSPIWYANLRVTKP